MRQRLTIGVLAISAMLLAVMSCDPIGGTGFDGSYIRDSTAEKLSKQLCAAIHSYEERGFDVDSITPDNMYRLLKPYLDTTDFELYLYDPVSRRQATFDAAGGEIDNRVICISHRDNRLRFDYYHGSLEFFYLNRRLDQEHAEWVHVLSCSK